MGQISMSFCECLLILHKVAVSNLFDFVDEIDA